MKTIFKLTLIALFLTSCGEDKFKDFSESKKKRIITENVKDYFDKNKTKNEISNYIFLLTQSNKLKPCPVKPLENLKILFKDDIYAGTSLSNLKSFEYLNNDNKNGEIDTYGIEFKVDENTGKIKGMESYINFTKWDDGEIGARNSLGSEIKSYEDDKVINIEKTYLNKELLQKVNKFYKSEMKQKQEENKSKCN
jgi:hypothetical protein